MRSKKGNKCWNVPTEGNRVAKSVNKWLVLLVTLIGTDLWADHNTVIIIIISAERFPLPKRQADWSCAICTNRVHATLIRLSLRLLENWLMAKNSSDGVHGRKTRCRPHSRIWFIIFWLCHGIVWTMLK